MELLGLPSPCTKEGEQTQASLDVITLVNSSWRLVQQHRAGQQRLAEVEGAARRTAAERDRLALNAARAREEVENRERAVAESCETARQASEQAEAATGKLKAAKEEVRKLMSVLLQREAKYSHEVRRTEQEAARLKERLLKVLVERGEGRGAGPPSLTTSGPHKPGRAGPRSRWNTEQDGTRREEELLRRLAEETARRDGEAAVLVQRCETALQAVATAVRESLLHLGTDAETVSKLGQNFNTRSADVQDQTNALVNLLLATIKNVKKPSEIFILQEELKERDEKIILYEQILVNYETSKEKQDGITLELKGLQNLERENILREKYKIEEARERVDRERTELEMDQRKLEVGRAELLRRELGCVANPPIGPDPPPLLERPGCELPSWVAGPVSVTPARAGRSGAGTGAGVVLGYSGPSSRPASRPGSRPASRAASLHRGERDRKSPAAAIITRRVGGRQENYTASLGRSAARPKSANLSPSRTLHHLTSNRRSAAASRSPSRGPDPHTASLSLPRQPSLTARPAKRMSGKWSKPPTPSPLSPATSDSEQNCATRSCLPQSSSPLH